MESHLRDMRNSLRTALESASELNRSTQSTREYYDTKEDMDEALEWVELNLKSVLKKHATIVFWNAVAASTIVTSVIGAIGLWLIKG